LRLSSIRRAQLLALLVPFLAVAQDRIIDQNVHGWYHYIGSHPIAGSKWGLYLEGQFRRHNAITQWQQLLLRPGVNYQLTDKVSLTAGYAFIRSHRYSDYAAPGPATNEHRIWEQVRFYYGSKPIAWNTRIRFENRFLSATNTVTGRPGYRYENRLRLFQQATVPLSARTYVTAYDEFWVYVKPYIASSAFDQNRAYGAFGVKVRPDWRVEVGYMNQALLQRSGRVLEANHTLVLAIYGNARLFSRR